MKTGFHSSASLAKTFSESVRKNLETSPYSGVFIREVLEVRPPRNLFLVMNFDILKLQKNQIKRTRILIPPPPIVIKFYVRPLMCLLVNTSDNNPSRRRPVRSFSHAIVSRVFLPVRGVAGMDRLDGVHVRHAAVRLVVLPARLRVRRAGRRALRRAVPHHVGGRCQLDHHRRVHRQRR